VTFCYGFDDEKHKKRRCRVCFMLLDIILVQWWHPVASSEALDLLHWEMHTVTYQRTATAIETASFAGAVDCCLFACCPGGRWGDTEQVVS
jgi:hypothetical protein